MKIHGWHIDGYGVHHDLHVTDLPAGLTIVAGPNEAGKTTLQHYLVGMLFGFTPVNRPDHHAPLRGGAYGGRLFVTDEPGRELTIHRGARRSSLRITGPDGPVDESELVDLLGGATRDLYQSVFAVHIDELAELRALSDDQVRDRVFSAGILGAGRTAHLALDRLADERDALLKPGGRSPEKYLIKRLRAELIDARSALAEVRRDSKGLPALVQRITVIDVDRARLRDERDRLQSEQSLLGAVAGLWPAWTAAAEARAELHQMGPVAAVAPDAAERLHRAVARAEDLQVVSVDTAEALADATAAVTAIEPPGPALDHQATIAELATGAAVERERLGAMSDHQAQIDHLTIELGHALAVFGPEADEAWLHARPARPEAGAELRAVASQVIAAHHHVARVDEIDQRTSADLADAEAELAAIEATLGDAPRHRVDRARQAVEDATVLVTLVGQREALTRRLDAAERPLPTFVVPTLATLALVITAAGAAALAAGAPLAGVLAMVGGLVIGAMALAMRRVAQAPHGADELSALDHDLTPVLAQLGLATCPTLADATNVRTRAEALAAEAGRLERERAAAAQRRRQLDDRAARHRDRARTERASAASSLHQANDRWSGWLESQGLPAALDPTAAAEVLDALERARSLQRSLATVRAQRQRAGQLHQAYGAQVSDLLAACGLTTVAAVETDPLAVVDELHTLLGHDLDARRRLDDAAIARQSASRTHDHAAQRARAADADVRAVLDELQVATVAEARTTVDRTARADELRRTTQRADQDLTTVIGAHPERLDQARRLLAQADPTRWQDELRRLDHALADAHERLDLLVAERAHLERERDELERSADVPTNELRVADLEAQLVEAVTRWASLTVAHQMVEATLARYQRERQPDVVRRAADHFERVTGGRYRRLEVRGQEIVAIDRSGREIPASSLSQGSIEQLYLCMRFALAESFARTARLPLLLDDITVNADGGRLPLLAETIADIAAGHQVFVFTCHDATVELLSSAVPEARLITLPATSSPSRRIGLAG